MFRPPTKYSEYLQDVRKSIDYILKRVNATTVNKIVAGTNVTISPADGTGIVTINASGGGGGGLPAGGTTGQILAKINNVDYNAEWIDNYALWTSTVKHEVKAGEAINKGQAVYVSSADGTNMIVSKASNALEATSSKTLGILAQSLAHNAKGFVITEGLLAGLDTSAAGAAGDPVWLGTDGNLLFGLANKPYAPANMVSIGVVTRKNSSNGEIFVRIQNGFELDELHNVDARNPNNNDGIFYNSTTQLWEHKPVSAVYATPTLAQVTTAGNTTTNAITVGNATVNGPVNSVFAHTPTTNYTGFGGVQLNVADGTERGFFKLNPQTGEVKIGSTGSGYFTTLHTAGVERMRIFFSSGNVAINTTTDAGYKLDVNGIARVVTRIDAGSFTPGAGASAYTFATTGTITAAGGYNLRSPIYGDSGFSGLGDSGGPTIYSNNATVARFLNIGGALNGTSIDILQGYNPGAGTGSVTGVRHSYALYPSADNTVSYTSFLSNPYWISAPFYNRITGPIRGFYFANGLYNTQKLVDVIAFESNGGRVVFAGETPSASGGVSRGVYLNQTLTAAANNDVLVGLDINPTFTNGAFTGVQNYAVRLINSAGVNVLFRTGVNNSGTHKISFSNLGATTNSFISAASSGTFSNVNLVLGQAFFDGSTVNTTNNIVIQSNSSTVFEPRTAISYAYLTGDAYVVTAVNNTNAVLGFSNGSNATSTRGAAIFAIAGGSFASTARLDFAISNVNAPVVTTADVAMSLFNSKNFAIGTTTDAGYKLDVVGGDARFNGVRVGLGNNSIGTNTVIGANSLGVNTTGFENTSLGYNTLRANTTGNYNTAIASESLRFNTTGSNNTALGQNAMQSNVSGNSNTSIGFLSLRSNTSGSDNIAIGVNAGNVSFPNTTGSNNIFIGNSSTGVSATESNRTWIGNSSTTSTWVGGNLLVGTTTNAGYKLDVNGTARVQTNLNVGDTAFTATTPNYISLGGTYATSGYGAKLKLLDSGATQWGIGVSTAGINYYGTTHNFFAGSTTSAIILSPSADTASTSPAYIAIGQSYSSVAGANPKLRLFGTTYGFGVSAGQVDYIAPTHVFYANGSEAMRITSTGNVGVGTATPTDKFHIVDNTNGNKFGRISAGGTDASAAWVAQNDQVDNVVYRVFGSAVTGTQMGISLARSASLMANLGGSGKFLVGTYSATDFVMGTGNQERMRLVDSTGNFLIGTTVDNGNKLTVNGTIDSTGYRINNVAGYTGILNIPTNPPGQQNIDIQGGIIINIF